MVRPPQVCGRPGCLEQAYRNGPPLRVGDPARLEPHLPHLRMAASRYFGSRPRFVRGRSVTSRMSSIASLTESGSSPRRDQLAIASPLAGAELAPATQ